MQFEASKFNPETDEDRPKVGEIVTLDGASGEKFIVGKYIHMTFSDFMKAEDPELDGYDKVIVRGHITRPGVIWMVWANKVQEETEPKEN